MTGDDPRSSARQRRPTDRLVNYDPKSGRLESLAKSVGRRETPPTAEAQALKQSKQQAAIAAARGNTSRPDALPPLKRKAEDSEGEDSDFDEAADPPLLDYQLDDLEHEIDRIEWLYQAIERLGDLHNYRDDPNYQDEDSLRALRESYLQKESNALSGSASDGKTHRIKTGSTHVLKPSTTGHSSRVQLVRTDGDTITLDGTRLDTQSRQEYGRAPLPKLARTDQSTIGLDGKPVSPPRAQAMSHRKPSNPTASCLTQPTASNPSNDKPPPAKKRAVVPLARIQALRKANKEASARKVSGQSVTAPSTSSKSAPQPARPVAPCGPRPPEIEDPAPPGPNNQEQRPTPPTDDDAGAEQQGEQEEGSGGDDGEGSDDDDGEPAGFDALTKRQQAQLGRIAPEPRRLVKWVTQHVKLQIITTCPFPERMKATADDDEFYFDTWMVIQWGAAHEEIREGRVKLTLKDHYVNYIRNQLPVIRNSLKKICDPLVAVHFDLRRSDPDHATLAKELTDGSGEKWLSPNLENDEERFQHPIIRDTIREAFFRSPKSIGNRFREHLTPLVPIPTIAYACSIIRHSIKSFEVETSKATDLNSNSNSDDFTMFMLMLEKHGQENPAQLLDARILITSEYLKCLPRPTPVAVPAMNFGPDRDIDREGLEEIKELLGDGVPDIDDWEDIKAIYAKRKGKGKAGKSQASAAGPSGSRG